MGVAALRPGPDGDGAVCAGRGLAPRLRDLGERGARRDQLPCHFDQHGAQVRAVPKEVRRAAPAGKQKSDRREISLRRITELACEDEIVAPIVGCLTAAGRHVVQRHRGFREPLTAVGADGTMLLDEPSPRFRIGDASRGVRGELEGTVGGAALGALLSASRAAPSSRAGAIGIEHFMVSPD